jgi:indole-3-glycerol phosphate synthase
MDILKKIITQKQKEVAQKKKLMAIEQLKKSTFFQRRPLSLKQSLQTKKPGIIAEFKRKSPSKGFINQNADAVEVTTGYAHAGATGLSVLTDSGFFGGDYNDLVKARQNNDIPMLRKDFIIDEYQVFETKSIGADVMLIIAAALDQKEIHSLTELAQNLGLEVLIEIHHEDELTKVPDDVDILGVNNRDLTTFNVGIEQSLKIARTLGDDVLKISESGLNSSDTIKTLIGAGFNGFLIGEAFMKTDNPAKACKNLIDQILA